MSHGRIARWTASEDFGAKREGGLWSEDSGSDVQDRERTSSQYHNATRLYWPAALFHQGPPHDDEHQTEKAANRNHNRSTDWYENLSTYEVYFRVTGGLGLRAIFGTARSGADVPTIARADRRSVHWRATVGVAVILQVGAGPEVHSSTPGGSAGS